MSIKNICRRKKNCLLLLKIRATRVNLNEIAKFCCKAAKKHMHLAKFATRLLSVLSEYRRSAVYKTCKAICFL